MPTLVHLADEKQAKSILKNGIKPGKYMSGVYCMPVLPEFYVSHQWLRELKSTGVRTIVAVYFKADSSEMVYAGRYDRPHKKITLGEAIKEILSLDNPLGYELIIDRKIEADEISKVKHLSQNIGWRYAPNSHERPPCVCEICLRGTIKGMRIRKKAAEEDQGAE